MKTTAFFACLLVGVSYSAACTAPAIEACTTTYTSVTTSMTTNPNLATFCTATQTYAACIKTACGGTLPQTYLDGMNGSLRSFGIECDLSGGGAGRLMCPHMLLLVAATLIIARFFR